MRFLNFYRNSSIRAAGWVASFMRNLTPRRLLGLALILAAPTVSAQGIAGMLSGWNDGATAAIEFAVVACLLIGLCGVGYGCKLIMDKSNDRADVKNSHILVSLLGGALLCVIWFVVEVLVETSGGSNSDIGAAKY